VKHTKRAKNPFSFFGCFASFAVNENASTLRRAVIILLVSGVAAIVANLTHPNKIPWVQDWSAQVEGRAKKKNIRVVPLSVAWGSVQNGQGVFIDARPVREFEEGHIPGAVSIPLAGVDDQFETVGSLIDSGSELIVYCSNRECDDALLLAIALKTMGASDPLLFVGGFEAWEQSGGNVESGP